MEVGRVPVHAKARQADVGDIRVRAAAVREPERTQVGGNLAGAVEVVVETVGATDCVQVVVDGGSWAEQPLPGQTVDQREIMCDRGLVVYRFDREELQGDAELAQRLEVEPSLYSHHRDLCKSH